MRRVALIFIMILISIPVLGQVSGYMGKRALGSYNLSLAPNLMELLDGTAYEPRISFAHSLGFAYVISRDWTAGLDLTLLKTETYSETEDLFGNSIKSDVLVSGKSFGLSFTKYGGKKGKLPAPLGKFFQTRVLYTIFKTVNNLGEPTFYLSSEGDTRIIFPGKETDNFSSIGLALGIGNNIIIKDRVIFQYGGEISYHYFMLQGHMMGFDGDGAYSKSLAADAIQNSYTVVLKAGLSGLLF